VIIVSNICVERAPHPGLIVCFIFKKQR